MTTLAPISLTFWCWSGAIYRRTDTDHGSEAVTVEQAEKLREAFAQQARDLFRSDLEASLQAARMWLQLTSALDDLRDRQLVVGSAVFGCAA